MVESTDGAAHDLLDAQVSCRHLIDISPDAVVIHHLDRIILVNDESLRLFEVSNRSELLGRSMLELFPADVRSFARSRFDNVIIEHQQAPLVETTVCRSDGTPAFVQMLAIPVPRSDGSTAVLVALRDISASKRAKAESQRSENQVRMILETAMDGIISIDEQQKIILFNRAAETIFGWKADEVLGRSVETLIPSRFASQHHQSVEQFGRGQIPSRRMSVHRQVLALRSSGEEFPIEASISHTKIDEQRVYTVILRDVTELVHHRRQIEQQSQMLDHVSDAVSVIDAAGRITYWNQAAHELFGWSTSEVLGQDANTLLNRVETRLLSDVLRQTQDRHSWSGELNLTTREGKTITVEHRSTILKNSSGEIEGYLFIDIDITNRKKREQLANRSQRLESIGTLASGIAHDLNNVLTPILMGAKLLSSDRPAANRAGLLDTMVASAQRGAALIQQLLSFAGGVRGEQSPIRIEKLVGETRGLLEHTLPKSIEIRTRVAENCPAVIGDSTELTQILMNLCVNARDAMPDGGTLTIEADQVKLNGTAAPLHPDARPGTYLLVTVADTGMGMSQEVLNRIFDPFFTTKEVGKGTGIGLATVQGIVKSHGGFIIVYSELNQGSKFSIYLPAIPAVEAAKVAGTFAADDLAHGELILLVDDETMIRNMTSAVLELAGYRVFTASDGAAAISCVLEHPNEISVVLMDMMMPGLSGLETLERIRQIESRIQVIACSGLWTNQRESEVMERGATAFLPKPYSDQQLLQLLAQTLKRV